MTVVEQRAEVFQSIYGVTKFSDVLAQFESDYNSVKNKGVHKVLELYKKYSYAIFFMYSPSSIRNNLVKFKNVIKDQGGKYQANALEAFTIDSIYSPIQKKDEERKERIEEKVFSGDSTIIEPQTVIDQINKIKEELNTKSYSIGRNQNEPQVRAYRILALLALSTGRRFTELLKTLIIEKKGKTIFFDGLLKGNDERIEGHLIGLEYKEVKKYLSELRAFANTEEMTEEEVNAKYAKVFNNALKRFGETGLISNDLLTYFRSVKREVKGELIDGEPNIKGCRDIYAKAGAVLFHDESKDRDYTQTASRILGHKYVIQSSEGYIGK